MSDAKQVVVESPPWLTEIIEKWRSGIAHVFLLHGNVDDIATPGGFYVKDLLLSSGLLAGRDCVIVYNRSKGLTFPVPSHRERFLKLAGLDGTAVSGALAALQQARGQAAGDVPLPVAPGQALPLIEQALTANNDGRPGCGLLIDTPRRFFQMPSCWRWDRRTATSW